MPSTAAYLSNKSSSFFQLPTEVRHGVYGRVFPCSTFRLRRQVVGACEPQAPSTSATALLLTCYAIHEEAVPLFYRAARIHFSMSWREPTESIILSPIRLPLLVHISIDFCCLGLDDQYEEDLERMQFCPNKIIGEDCECPKIGIEEAADRRVAECINKISTNSPLLQSFTLHLLSSITEYGLSGEDKDILLYALGSAEYRGCSSSTMDSLKKLKVRDTIVIVAVAVDYPGTNAYMYSGIREAIAPLEEWEFSELSEWPGISLTGEQKKDVHKVLEHTEMFNFRKTEVAAEIRFWYYQPPGSKALVLPNHKLLKDKQDSEGDSEEDDSEEMSTKSSEGKFQNYHPFAYSLTPNLHKGSRRERRQKDSNQNTSPSMEIEPKG